jgi:hypothetical protein
VIAVEIRRDGRAGGAEAGRERPAGRLAPEAVERVDDAARIHRDRLRQPARLEVDRERR